MTWDFARDALRTRATHQEKVVLVLVTEQHRYQKYISDLDAWKISFTQRRKGRRKGRKDQIRA
jgi:hypothetical protein